MTCWICMKKQFVWRTQDDRKVCRICGCTDDDCRQCIAKTGESCYWIEPNLCSACAEEMRQ